MAKSSATFGKKEKEKKKAAHRKEKEEKREERKANSLKGGSLDDMLAYVDEFGNISSTPPDPTKKKVEINVEDIQLGVPKYVEEPKDLIHNGSVTFFNDAKGFGFIKDLKTQESFFVHANQLSGLIKENDKVSFEVGKGPKGLMAINVKVI